MTPSPRQDISNLMASKASKEALLERILTEKRTVEMQEGKVREELQSLEIRIFRLVDGVAKGKE